MRISNVAAIRFGLALPAVLFCTLAASSASAQTPILPAPGEPAGPAGNPAEPAEGPPLAPAGAEPAVADSRAPAAAPPADAGTTNAASDLAALKDELADTKSQLEELRTRQDAAETAASEPKEDLLKIYGFADMGIQREWINNASILDHVFATQTSFVIGNVNLYFDAQPIKDWRALIEVRFTNAPLGDTATYGGLAGTYSRKDTFSYDPHGTAINAPMWSGAVVLERAWIEWKEHQEFKLRVGNWFTPFGIWNEDHGSPTLIALALPQVILQRWFPVRQTGLMGYGNTFAGEWELGYVLTFSNGRQELSNFNFEGKFGYGGRVYARRDTGAINTTFGLSYFTGTTSDQTIDVTGVNPVTFQNTKTWEYNEHVAGADFAVDIDATRIRSEATLRRVTYTPGHRAPGDPTVAPGSLTPDMWQQDAYVLVANQLPWAGIEPYVWAEIQGAPQAISDGVFAGSVGLNVHFNTAITWKSQVTRGVFFNWLYKSQSDSSVNNITAAYSRIVMAF